MVATPIAGTVSASTSQGRAITLPKSAILALCSDPGGLALTVIAAGPGSAQGGVVTTDANNVSYAPPSPQFLGSDSFSYTIQNTAGATASGTVNVTVNAPTFPPNAVTVTQTGGTFTAVFNGVPGLTYAIECSDNLTATWQSLVPPGTVTANASGVFQFTDPTGNPRRFYRAGTAVGRRPHLRVMAGGGEDESDVAGAGRTGGAPATSQAVSRVRQSEAVGTRDLARRAEEELGRRSGAGSGWAPGGVAAI